MMGSGGIGGYVGARLIEAGEDVAFIARGAHLQALQRNGLRVASPVGDVDLPRVEATGDPRTIGRADIVIFAVKLYDSQQAAQAIVPMVGPGTRVITLQNGIDSVNTLSCYVPKEQVVGGTIYVSAYLGEPGVVVHAGGHSDMIVGGVGDASIEALRDVGERTRGLDVRVVADIDKALWTKFVTLSTFSGATSLLRSGIGAILADREARTFMEQLRDEGMAVAAALGHALGDGFAEGMIARFTALPPHNKSSMANDLEHGKPLELAWLSGRLHALGQEHGIPTPGHTAVYRALHLYAAGASQSEPR
jgi:2-dehydropantoate 2-reductase